MSIRNAALLATIGTAVLAILLLWRLVNDLLALMRGLNPLMDVLASLVSAFAAVTVVVFFFVFHRGRSS
ncbi:MAG: hypothetical protein ACYDBY_04805 [Thermoanaerobaculia bacterium]